MAWQSFVGLEIHVQLLTQSKVFCSCAAAFGSEPNTNVCPVCLGYPGVLPALNGEAIEMGYTVARALNCTLAEECMFDRKNYFYPDLPKNYQISQFHHPLGTNGWIDLEFRRKKKRIRIHEIHLEEDAGKMIHAGDMSLLDYNRAGTPLLEIVTEPDLEIGEEAEALLQELRRIVRYLAVCDGNMEEGSMRCDANVSVNLRDAGLGSKVEIKNLNSSRFVRKALTHEIERQQEILERGGTVAQETRLWNENRDLTESMRSKESAHDYRYFPEPDMPRFRTDDAFLARVEARLVELPAARRERFATQYGLDLAQVELLCEERATADWYERCVAAGGEATAVAAWLAGDVRQQLNRAGATLDASPLTPERLAELLRLLDAGTIHGPIAKQTLRLIFERDDDPEAIIRAEGWELVSDRGVLGEAVAAAVAAHPQAAEQIRAGDRKPIGFLVGQVMKATGGRAEPTLVRTLIDEALSVSTIDVLSFGGAIAGRRQSDGLVVGGNLADLNALFENDPDLPSGIRFAEVALGEFLSEEILPSDWATLIATVQERLSEGSSRALVIGHGTDTLAYTASLLAWLFADARIPIVLTASAVPGEEGGRGEAIDTLRRAVAWAAGGGVRGETPTGAAPGTPGVHVLYGSRLYPPVNLKYLRADATSAAFETWNVATATESTHAIGREARALPVGQLSSALEEAVRRTHVAKVYPGMRGETLIANMDAGVRHIVLELYDTGTANLREAPFSLRRAIAHAREAAVDLFCTSQQEGVVDFSGYVTAHELWRGGAIPMGGLTTESVYTRLLVAQIEAGARRGGEGRGGAQRSAFDLPDDSSYRDEVVSLMEDAP